MQISPNLIKHILDGYLTDNWCVKFWKQLLTNDNLGPDKAILSFIFGSAKPLSSAAPYLLPRSEPQKYASDFPASESIQPMLTRSIQLIYHLDRITSVCRLCIFPTVAPDLLAIVHGKGHLGFGYCHEIISRLWYIRGLTKILRSFICHCPQCLALQTRKHAPYGSLQPIHSSPIPFFTLILDFILDLPLITDGYNALMFLTYKFSKKITLIEGKDT